MPDSLVLGHVSKKFIGFLGNKNPYFWHNNAPKIQIEFYTHGNVEFSHYWQLSAETADMPLLFPIW